MASKTQPASDRINVHVNASFVLKLHAIEKSTCHRKGRTRETYFLSETPQTSAKSAVDARRSFYRTTPCSKTITSA
eukprot:759082-Amphidinium_carterae.1